MPNKNYEKVSLIYDYLMQSVDYEAFADYMEAINTRLNFTPQVILDLACGTGGSTLPLAARGYRVVGLDVSEEMLAAAKEKARRLKLQAEFIRGDMRTFTLSQPVDMAVIFQEGLNYLLSSQDVLKTFHRVFKALSPGGVFAFDLHALPLLPTGSGEVSMVEEDNFTLIWQSRYQPEEALWEIALTGFVKEGSGLYERFQETHRERHYSPAEIADLLQEAGFSLQGIYKSFTFEEDLNARRLFVVARKGKGEKVASEEKESEEKALEEMEGEAGELRKG